VDQRDDEDARARNRRVEFRILERAGAERDEEEEQGPRRVAVRPGRVAGASDAASNLPRAADGATHYGVARHVDIPAGASSLVTILSRRVPGAEVLLFRPDASARGSDRHPLRAVRIENATEVDLVGGPVSLFARGAFVGEGLLEPLAAGRIAFVPFAVDGATEVEVEAEVEETPARILALSRGRLQVERTRTRTTRYRVRAGEHAPPRLFVQHARAAGYTPVDLPPETEDAGAALLVPLPLTPGRASELAVAERTAVTGSVALLAQREVDLRPYLEGSALEEGDRQRLDRVLGLRDRLVELAASEGSLQTRLADVAQRSAELRASITALRDTGARGRDTRRTLVARLEEAVAAAERLATELAEQRAERLEAEATLRELVSDWEIAPPE
ncbi:MAG: hypothetical protein CMH59_19120, partial [Myxococcales bacterium]|nr:hypothetical protein [Myxococcales bacterium]